MTESQKVRDLISRKPAVIQSLVAQLRQWLDADENGHAADVYTTDTEGGDVRHHYPRTNAKRRYMYSEIRFPPAGDYVLLRLTVGNAAKNDHPFSKTDAKQGRIEARLDAGTPIPGNVEDWIKIAKRFRINEG